jgi:hypothetical protein
MIVPRPAQICRSDSRDSGPLLPLALLLRSGCRGNCSGKEKSGPNGPLERGKGREEVSGEAMQDEVEANAKTLGLEETTILEEG